MFCFCVQKQKEKLEYSPNQAFFTVFSRVFSTVIALRLSSCADLGRAGGGKRGIYPEALTSNKSGPVSGQGSNPCS